MATFDEIKIVLKRSSEDPPLFSTEYQADIRKVFAAFRSEGVKIQTTSFFMDAVGAGGGATGEFLALASSLGPALIGALGGFFAGRNGRKVRLKIGDVEAEASTQEEVEKLLQVAREYKRDEEPRKIVP